MEQKPSKLLKLIPYLPYFLIIAGILYLISGLIVFIFEREDFANSIKDIGLGIINVILGIEIIRNKQFQKINWKEIPLGFKILIVYFSISVLSNLINLPKSVNQPNIILGIFVNPPFSAFLSLVYLIFSLILVLSILSKTGWKLVSGIALFNFLNFSFMIFRIMLMPSNELSAMFDLPVDSLNVLSSNTSLIVFIPLIIISLAIFLYINKNKEYFSNDK